jgi:hypothetical protein
VRFNPDDDKQHSFLVGSSNKKVKISHLFIFIGGNFSVYCLSLDCAI